MKNIRLIALDLDGTLLRSDKTLSRRAAAALTRAAERGIEIVPATGRFFSGMPGSIRALPFLHYAITINGAAIYDIRQDRDIASFDLPLARAVEIMAYLDRLPVIYDCYMDNWGWMTRSMQERAAEYVPDEHYIRMIRTLRTPVEELKTYLLEKERDVQKVQLFTTDSALRRRLLRELPERFVGIAVSSASPNSVEINCAAANKGAAVERLAGYLGLSAGQTMAFGDGLNDVTMLRAAGLGVAMGNAVPEAKAAADVTTGSNDDDGVAAAIEKYCF